MTANWSNSPFGKLVGLADLGRLGDNVGENNGESRRVCRLPDHPGWLFKEYAAPAPLQAARRLDRLIRVPEGLPPASVNLVDGHTSWTVARVVDDARRTIGVVMPVAAPAFSLRRTLPSGRVQEKALEIDLLALSEQRQVTSLVPTQGREQRIAVCLSMASVGALFEEQGMVYLDWSYANVFWSTANHTAYVIDLDGCSFGPRPQIESPNWEDPLVPMGQQAGNEVDRYRLALLTARCLTGERMSLTEIRSGLVRMRRHGGATSKLADLLIRSLNAAGPQQRPSVADLRDALQAAHENPQAGPAMIVIPDTHGVKGWKPITRPIPTSPPAPPAPTIPKLPTVPPPPPRTTPRPAPNKAPARTPARTVRPGSTRMPPPRSRTVVPASPPSGNGSLLASILAVAVIIALAILLAIVF